MFRPVFVLVLSLVAGGWFASQGLNAAEKAEGPLVVIVMDPLSAPLSCDCVKGYAQRKYEHLGAYLQKEIGRPVKIHWSESLATALKEKSGGKADLIVGKYSVVAAQSKAAGLKMLPVASLSGKDGAVTQSGLILVRSGDPAKAVSDLKGYRVLFGPPDCDEKSTAVKTLLRKHDVSYPEKDEVFTACSESATLLLELKPEEKACAVISSYAQPLLEGCGNIKKGDLRVVGESAKVPFVTAFLNSELPEEDRKELLEALLDVGTHAPLLSSLETRDGFVPFKPVEDEEPSKPSTGPRAALEKAGSKIAASGPQAMRNGDWPGWRGTNRDAHVAWLPDSLPHEGRFDWTATLPGDGIGGLAVAEGVVVVGCRDALDRNDVFLGIDAATGKTLWTLSYAAPGKLDYGNSPRATPLLSEGAAYLFGALGNLHCVDLQTGAVLWKENLAAKYLTSQKPWGLTGSPLLVDDRLIVQPGGTRAGIVALDPDSGEALWESEGHAAGHSSLIAATVDSGKQIIGYDDRSLGGWDISTGKRLWTVKPAAEGDFNVPTPMYVDGRLLAITENNGARLYRFDELRRLEAAPTAKSERLTPDAHSPVVVGNRIMGVSNGLKALALDDLRLVSTLKDRAFRNYASLIASENRLLALTSAGELVLVETSSVPSILDRISLQSVTEAWSHPALAGTRLYVRLGRTLLCLNLAS